MVKNKIKKGFTLIELLFVIAIIALLSSIILAQLRDSKNKAIESKFESEMQQLINALELYRSDNGKYPYEGGKTNGYYFTNVSNANVESSNNFGDVLSNYLKPKYISSLPQVPTNSYGVASAYSYYTNKPGFSWQYRCVGDTSTPTYLIYIWSSNPFLSNLYSGLPRVESSINGGVSFTPLTTSRCIKFK